MDVQESALTRRSFLQGMSVAALGATAGVSLFGCGTKDTTDSAAGAGTDAGTVADPIWDVEALAEPSETIEADVCVIGAGGTGCAAALEAAEAGLTVVQLEKMGVFGGSFIGTEGMFGVETHWTKEAGETLTIAEAVQNCMIYHHWWPDHALYESFFSQTAETVLWLEAHNVNYRSVVALGISHQSWHVYEIDGEHGPGVLFMKKLSEAVEKAGVTTLFKTPAKKLVMEGGKVAGVLAVKEDGSVLKVSAPVVVIGTGGYANNNDIIYDIAPAHNEHIVALGMNGRDGDGLKMAKDAGADFCDFPGTVMWCGPVTIGAEWTSNAYSASVQPILWVNQDAKRFVNENLWIDDFVAAGIALNNQKKGYIVFTDADLTAWETVGPYGQVFSFGIPGTPLPEVRKEMEGLDSVHKADTIEDLAAAVGLDAAALKATIDTYNGYVKAGKDAEFGKPAQFLYPVETGPFYIGELSNGFYTTVGGIRINENAQVLDAERNVIPGLYAGGSDAGGLYGDSYDVSRAPGSQASFAINSGRLAAKNAKEYLGA